MFGKKQQVLGFLVVLAVITFLDRIAISVAAPRMQKDLHIETSLWGWIAGVFTLSYGLFEIPTGAMGDRLGQRRVLTRIVAWWSAFTALTGLMTGFRGLLATRFLFGVGEAGAYPNISAALARWFPARDRAQAQGWIWGASRLGGALAPLIVVPLQIAVGWRASFGLLGLIGFVWGVAWYAWYREPQGTVLVHNKTNWKELLRSRQMLLLFAMYWCFGWEPWFYFSWYPSYLLKMAHVSEREMGFYAALPYLLGVVANLGGGWVFDRVAERKGMRFAGRVIGGGSLLCSAMFMFGMTLVHGKIPLVIVSALGFGVGDFMVPAAWAVAMNMGGRRAGTVTGTMNMAGQVGGFVCSVLAGYLVQATGSYNAPVIVVAFALLVGAAAFSLLDGSKQIFSEAVS